MPADAPRYKYLEVYNYHLNPSSRTLALFFLKATFLKFFSSYMVKIYGPLKLISMAKIYKKYRCYANIVT
jgi:hypothetical protein